MSLTYKTTEWNNKKVILGEGPINPEAPVKILVGFHGAGSTPENMLVHGNRLQPLRHGPNRIHRPGYAPAVRRDDRGRNHHCEDGTTRQEALGANART